MKLSQKRSCNGCKAEAFNSYASTCQLGYNIAPDKIFQGHILSHRPLEPCYKPKTNSDFISLQKEIHEKSREADNE